MTCARRQDGRSVRIEILDEGVGLPEGDVERVFDKFYRVRKSDHVRPGRGSGSASPAASSRRWADRHRATGGDRSALCSP